MIPFLFMMPVSSTESTPFMYLSALSSSSKTRQYLGELKPGLAGIRQTLDFMNQFVEQYKTSPEIRELALSLVKHLPQKDFDGEIKRLFSFVQNRIRYVRDVHDVETVQTPIKTLEYRQGDCDDKSTLLAALLQSLGHPTRFHAMGFRPGYISHVLLEVYHRGHWIPLDATEQYGVGWAPHGIRQSMYR